MGTRQQRHLTYPSFRTITFITLGDPPGMVPLSCRNCRKNFNAIVMYILDRHLICSLSGCKRSRVLKVGLMRGHQHNGAGMTVMAH